MGKWKLLKKKKSRTDKNKPVGKKSVFKPLLTVQKRPVNPYGDAEKGAWVKCL